MTYRNPLLFTFQGQLPLVVDTQSPLDSKEIQTVHPKGSQP